MGTNGSDDYLPAANPPKIGMKWDNNHGSEPASARFIRERIAAREKGLPEPKPTDDRTQDGRIIGGDELSLSRDLDAGRARLQAEIIDAQRARDAKREPGLG